MMFSHYCGKTRLVQCTRAQDPGGVEESVGDNLVGKSNLQILFYFNCFTTVLVTRRNEFSKDL